MFDSRISVLEQIAESHIEKQPEMNPPSDPLPPIANKPTGDPYFNYHVKSAKTDSLGRTVYGGPFTAYTIEKKNFVSQFMRLNSDGTLDTTFDMGIGFDSGLSRIAITTGNEIIAAGGYFTFNGSSVPSITKLLANGNRDATYQPGIYASVFDFVLTPAQQVIAIGDFYFWNTFGTSQETIVRINADGTRDTSFTIGTSFNPVRTAYTMDLQSDGKFIIGGGFNSYAGSSSPKIIRLNANGTYDNTFVTGTGFNGPVNKLDILADGSVLVVGDFTSYNGTTGLNRIAKLNSNGTINAAFNTAVGTGFATAPQRVKEIPGVGIFVTGLFTTFKGAPAGGIVCLTSSGSVCPGINFGSGAGGVLYPYVNDIVKLDANTLLVVGSFSSFNTVSKSNLAALNLDGSNSSKFNSFKGVDNTIDLAHVQADGKVLLSGQFILYDPIPAAGILRMNQDKTVDEEFTTTARSLPPSSIENILIDGNDRIWVAGSIVAGGGYNSANLMRIATDGTIDTACTNLLGSGLNDFSSSLLLQTDNKLLISGNFTSFNSNITQKVVRLLPDCTWDTSFSTGSGVTGLISRSFVLSTGKILHIGSYLTNYSGTTVSKVIRVNSNGTLDGTYPNNSTKPHIYADAGLAVDSLDRLYLTKVTGVYNGTGVGSFARILADGTVDTTFNVGTGFNSLPLVIKVFGNKIYVGGSFSTFNSASRKYFVILNLDGSEDITTERPIAVMPVSDVFINSAGKIEFAYKVPEISY